MMSNLCDLRAHRRKVQKVVGRRQKLASIAIRLNVYLLCKALLRPSLRDLLRGSVGAVNS